jgi:hypothetical protein
MQSHMQEQAHLIFSTDTAVLLVSPRVAPLPSVALDTQICLGFRDIVVFLAGMFQSGFGTA